MGVNYQKQHFQYDYSDLENDKIILQNGYETQLVVICIICWIKSSTTDSSPSNLKHKFNMNDVGPKWVWGFEHHMNDVEGMIRLVDI